MCALRFVFIGNTKIDSDDWLDAGSDSLFVKLDRTEQVT